MCSQSKGIGSAEISASTYDKIRTIPARLHCASHRRDNAKLTGAGHPSLPRSVTSASRRPVERRVRPCDDCNHHNEAKKLSAAFMRALSATNSSIIIRTPQ